MQTERICNECGNLISADDEQDLCPRCLPDRADDVRERPDRAHISPSAQTAVYWTLQHGDELVGTLVPGPPQEEFPFPWEWGTFTPTGAFEAVKHVFAEQFRCPEDADDRSRFWERLQRHGLSLRRHPDGRAFRKFNLHVIGSTAWWRV